jgi:hypothetical protein
MTRVLSVIYRVYGEEESAHPELAVDRMLLTRLFGRLM